MNGDERKDMHVRLPKVVEAYFQASNLYDSGALSACFTENAVLYDEGCTFSGSAAIQAHITKANRSAAVQASVATAIEKPDKLVVTAMLTGNFDPFPLDFHFTIENEKIARLHIGAVAES